jgi:hypothetical protein
MRRWKVKIQKEKKERPSQPVLMIMRTFPGNPSHGRDDENRGGSIYAAAHDSVLLFCSTALSSTRERRDTCYLKTPAETPSLADGSDRDRPSRRDSSS